MFFFSHTSCFLKMEESGKQKGMVEKTAPLLDIFMRKKFQKKNGKILVETTSLLFRRFWLKLLLFPYI